MNKAWKWLSITLSMALAGALLGWAGATVLRTPDDPAAETAFTTVAVTDGAVESSVNLNTIAQWSLTPAGTNRAQGVVTSVSTSAGSEVDQGDVLYSVDARPIAVAAGAVPAYRDLSVGATGEDVRQLQNMLAAGGHYAGSADGKFESLTARAVREWQKALGQEQTGNVLEGDVIYVPSLPTRVALDETVIKRGATLAGGETVLNSLGIAPSFTMPVSDNQAGLLPEGTQVNITAPSGATWVAAAVSQSRDSETQLTTVALDGVDGQTVCGAECSIIPVGAPTTLQSRVVTVARVEGLVVPTAAIATEADGDTVLLSEDGTRSPVTVQASSGGISVIDGVPDGFRARIPAEVPAS